jgi:hypothetical protein
VGGEKKGGKGKIMDEEKKEEELKLNTQTQQEEKWEG